MIRAISCLVLGMAVSATAVCDESRYGIVKKEPQGDYSQWFIGDKELSMGEDASIKMLSGPFDIGACAQFNVTDGVIQWLTTRPMSHCDSTDYDAYLAGFMRLASPDG
jgi:hypothetical protein